jgi:hypothetical protein
VEIAMWRGRQGGSSPLSRFILALRSRKNNIFIISFEPSWQGEANVHIDIYPKLEGCSALLLFCSATPHTESDGGIKTYTPDTTTKAPFYGEKYFFIVALVLFLSLTPRVPLPLMAGWVRLCSTVFALR